MLKGSGCVKVVINISLGLSMCSSRGITRDAI